MRSGSTDLILKGSMIVLNSLIEAHSNPRVKPLPGAAVPFQVNVVTTVSPVGLKLTGEIDATNAHLVELALLQQAPRTGSVHLDVTGLSFCDVAGIRALLSCARRLEGDRRLVLHGMPAQLEKVMNVMGWSELPGLEFCACDLEP